MEREFKTESPLTISKIWLCPSYPCGPDHEIILLSNDESKIVIPKNFIPTLRDFFVKAAKRI